MSVNVNTNNNPHSNKTQEEILKEIKEKSRLIHIQQKKADKEGFKDYGGAIGLQRLRRDRDALKGALTPLKIVSRGISCTDCLWRNETKDKIFCGYAELIEKGFTEVRDARRDENICGQDAIAFKRA